MPVNPLNLFDVIRIVAPVKSPTGSIGGRTSLLLFVLVVFAPSV